MRFSELGAVVRDIGPRAGNPRNSEGAFLDIPEGLLFVYSRFRGDTAADHARADLALLRSLDGGRSFLDEGVTLTCEGEGGVNMMCPSLMRMENGDVGLFYLVRITYTMTKIFLRRSADGGRTWRERVLCTPQEDFFVVNNDRALRLGTGRLLLPAASHRSGEGYFDSRAEAMYFYSDDDGRSWRPSPGKIALPYSAHSFSGLQEPGAVELSNGVIWSWARTDLGRQFEMFSLDGGGTWTAPEPSRFTSPNSPLCMKRGPGGALYAVWNPIPEYNGREEVEGVFTGGRTPLVIAASRDDGRSFSEPTAFEWDMERGYCYCAMHFTEQALMLAYCCGGRDEGSCLAKTRIRRVELAQLEAI